MTIIQLVVVAFTALCVGMSKTGIQGVTLLVVPFMAIAFGAKESTGVMLPMLCIADIIAVSYYKRIADWKIIIKLLPTAVIGFFVAILIDSQVEIAAFKKLMGITLALTILVMIWIEFTGIENKWIDKWWYSVIFGLLGGFTTMIGNVAGPVMAVYLLSMNKDKISFVGINAWFFLVVNLLKVPLQIFAWHNISIESLYLNLMMIPIIIIGAIIGIKIVNWFDENIFRRFVQIVTVLAVILMFVK